MSPELKFMNNKNNRMIQSFERIVDSLLRQENVTFVRIVEMEIAFIATKVNY